MNPSSLLVTPLLRAYHTAIQPSASLMLVIQIIIGGAVLTEAIRLSNGVKQPYEYRLSGQPASALSASVNGTVTFGKISTPS